MGRRSADRILWTPSPEVAVTQSNPPAPPTLLLHDGELADIRLLLCALGKPFLERLGDLSPSDEEVPWELVIATPRRVLDEAMLSMNPRPTLITLCDRDSRTLRTSLRRAGVQLMVRRPVHPAALRALLLHALYRGPEKRRTARVTVGAPVSLRAGLRKQSVILADLSHGGCRLISSRPLETRKPIKLFVPSEVSGGKAFSLRGTVLRCIPQLAGDPAYTVRFGKLREGTIELLARTLEAHSTGPAQLSAPASEAPNPLPGESVTIPADTHRQQAELSEEAGRILVGRELSLGGMRVDPSPLLDLGSDVRLAIHAGSQTQPLVVTAKVHRDDGDRGVVLRFHGLDASASQQLSAVLAELPVIEPSRRDAGAGMIVSEILAGAV